MNTNDLMTGDPMMDFRLGQCYRGLVMWRDMGIKLTGKFSCMSVARDMGFEGRTAKTLIKDIESKYPQINRWYSASLKETT